MLGGGVNRGGRPRCIWFPFTRLTDTFVFWFPGNVLISFVEFLYTFDFFSWSQQNDIFYPSIYERNTTTQRIFVNLSDLQKLLHLTLDAGLTHWFCITGHSFFGDRMLWPKSPLLTDIFATSLMMDNICRSVYLMLSSLRLLLFTLFYEFSYRKVS